MSLISKLNNNIKEKGSSLEKIKEVSISDLWTVYQRFLKRIPDISHLKNIVLFSGVASLLIFIFFAQRFSALYAYVPKNPVYGGSYKEGIVGKVENLNPLFTPANPAEDSVSSLLFSGLTKKNGSRQVISDLAKSWEVSPDGKTYTFKLRENLLWEDGHKLTADDVSFTVNTIQNPDVRSPLFELWKDVEVSSLGPDQVIFKLNNPYNGFLSITDFPVVPKHILEMIPPRSLRVAEFSSKPIANGPYRLESLKTLKESEEINLISNESYYGKKPYIKRIIFKTYRSYADLSDAYAKKEIMGAEKMQPEEVEKRNKLPNINIYQTAIPQYDVLFFNLRKGIFKEKAVREAVSLVIERNRIMNEAFNGYAVPTFSAILPGYMGHDGKLKTNPNENTAKEKLKEAGYVPEADGILKKGEEKATVRLVTTDVPQKIKEAEIIKTTLKRIGISVQVEKHPLAAFVQDRVRPRDFDLLLISQNLGSDSDLYAFWHGTQVNDPGLNLSGYSNRELDKYLEQGRTSSDPNFRIEKYKAISGIIWRDVPAVYLVWPNWLYGVSNEVKGIEIKKLVEPKDRFWNIENWYVLDEKAS